MDAVFVFLAPSQGAGVGNRDSLESRIDFPSVRESLKDQLRIQMTKSTAKNQDFKGNPFGGLATAFAPMMINYAVDNFVTPSGGLLRQEAVFGH